MATSGFSPPSNPVIPPPGLSPLQLALAQYFLNGQQLPISINADFVKEMQRFCDTKPLTPLDYDAATGQPKKPDISNLTGLSYKIIGDDIYLQRVAQDCGPDEDIRYELVYVGKRFQVASGTYAYFGRNIYSGRSCNAQDPGTGVNTGGF